MRLRHQRTYIRLKRRKRATNAKERTLVKIISLFHSVNPARQMWESLKRERIGKVYTFHNPSSSFLIPASPYKPTTSTGIYIYENMERKKQRKMIPNKGKSDGEGEGKREKKKKRTRALRFQKLVLSPKTLLVGHGDILRSASHVAIQFLSDPWITHNHNEFR